VIAGGFVALADAARQTDFFLDGEKWGFPDFLEIELEVAPLAVRDGRFGGRLRFF
jgi:hypothetical protein